jgi:hypothetical protein
MLADESGETVRPDLELAERAQRYEDFRASELKAIRRQFEVRDYEPAPPEDWSWR